MQRPVLWSLLLNGVLAAIFVELNQWVLANQLEETFVALALFYGCIVVLGNALLISQLKSA